MSLRPDQTDFKPLLDAWHDYNAAMTATPYDGDRVQGLGMRFCYLFKGEFKPHLCEMFGIDPEEFDYSMRREIMSEFYH